MGHHDRNRASSRVTARAGLHVRPEPDTEGLLSDVLIAGGTGIAGMIDGGVAPMQNSPAAAPSTGQGKPPPPMSRAELEDLLE